MNSLKNVIDFLQFTVSVDYVQAHFKCCAINSHLDYDMSLWKLQNFGQRDWVVPQTCCLLKNQNEEGSYLDPKPLNITLCQSLIKHEFNRARYKENCFNMIIFWYNRYLSILVSAILFIAVLEIMVLSVIVLICTKIASRRRNKQINCRTIGTSMQTNVLFNNLKRLAPQPQPHANSMGESHHDFLFKKNWD